MTKQTYFLVHDEARRRAVEFAKSAPPGWMVVFSEPKKKRAQEEKYHAMIGEIAKQVEHIGRKWDADDMKRLLVVSVPNLHLCALRLEFSCAYMHCASSSPISVPF